MKNYYKILGLKSDCSIQDVKLAYKKLAKIWHPDKNKSKNAHEFFIEIHEAYEILIDPSKRKLYDQLNQDHISSNLQNNSEKYNHYNSFVFKARESAASLSKMNFDLFLEKMFLGIGKTKYIFWGFIGLILIIVCLKILLEGKIGDIIIPMIFGLLILKQAYDGLTKNN